MIWFLWVRLVTNFYSQKLEPMLLLDFSNSVFDLEKLHIVSSPSSCSLCLRHLLHLLVAQLNSAGLSWLVEYIINFNTTASR